MAYEASEGEEGEGPSVPGTILAASGLAAAAGQHPDGEEREGRAQWTSWGLSTALTPATSPKVDRTHLLMTSLEQDTRFLSGL